MIVETTAVLVALDEIALELIKVFKAGGGALVEFETLWNDIQANPDLKNKVQAAWDAHSQLPAEIASIGIADAVELVITEAMYVPKFIAALKA